MTVGVVLATAACRHDAAPASAARRARVTIESPSGRSSSVVAELARTDAERERGLMFRERLGDGEGMLFVFDEEDDHSFWMKNTLIPLDMIFVDASRRVVGIVANAAPGSLEGRSGGRSRWVLEVRGGWAAERGVSRGDRVVIEELR